MDDPPHVLHNVGVRIEKLTTGFIAFDFDDGPAVGIVRSANKILQGGAKELARAMTYRFGVLNMAVGGASAGISAQPEDRDAAIAKFVDEATERAAAGRLMLDPGKGVSVQALAPLSAIDSRNNLRSQTVDGHSLRDGLIGIGAITAGAQALGGSVEGRSVAIDGSASIVAASAAAANKRGARVISVATPAGTVTDTSGLDPTAIAEAATAHGDGLVEHLGPDVTKPIDVFAAEAELLMTGSKVGAIDHNLASNLEAKVVAPIGPLPYTTKATIVAGRRDIVVLPDFVTTCGPTFADWPPGDATPEAVESAATDAIERLTASIISAEHGPVLEACHWAENFMKTWQDELPFGRPFAP